LASDIAASNGTIHVIDSVLLPPATESASGPPSPRRLIETAINRGVPLFNTGQTEACKAVYEVTVEALVGMPSVKSASKEKLTGALAAIKEQTSARDQAWTLRRALDAVYESLERAD
jgi:hypothetical protein